MNTQSSFTVYTAALHALILNSLFLAYFWLGLSWIDSIDSISANKRFSSSKTSSRKPYSNKKQQEKQKHSAETTINFSSYWRCFVAFSWSPAVTAAINVALQFGAAATGDGGSLGSCNGADVDLIAGGGADVTGGLPFCLPSGMEIFQMSGAGCWKTIASIPPLQHEAQRLHVISR